jgi:pimeloyl-ACP methyl ester carboxylesterase
MTWRISHRASGLAAKVSHVLLHGIGSNATSWSAQLNVVADSSRYRLLAWDAPGYGESTALADGQDHVEHYAARLWQWLDSLAVSYPVVLVGHSLGALMAVRAALRAPARVAKLILLAPARGYGQESASEQAQRLEQRLGDLERLGVEAFARTRSSGLLADPANPAHLEAVRQAMASIHPGGYAQAARMLVQSDLLADLEPLRTLAPHFSIMVASGEADRITIPQACDQVAQAAGTKRVSLGPVGHACPLEAADAVNALLGLQR